MTSPAVLYVDGDPTGEYLNTIVLPPNWGMVHCRERKGLGAVMNQFFIDAPDEQFYGWLADDLRPRTKGFDKKLEEAAGDWHFACSADDWYSLDFHLSGLVRKGHDMCGALCWGGELVRAAGSWAFLKHVGIDAAWCLVNSRLGNVRYCADVMVEHLQYRNGKRPKDLTDEITVPEADLYKEGIVELQWFHERSLHEMVAKIQAKMREPVGKANPPDKPPWWLETI